MTQKDKECSGLASDWKTTSIQASQTIVCRPSAVLSSYSSLAESIEPTTTEAETGSESMASDASAATNGTTFVPPPTNDTRPDPDAIAQEIPTTSTSTKPESRDPKNGKGKQKPAPQPDSPGAGAKLSAVELKKLKQQEKAARRFNKVAERGEPAQAENARAETQTSQGGPVQAATSQTQQAQNDQSASHPVQSQKHRQRRQSQHGGPPLEAGAVRIPFRPSNTNPPTATNSVSAAPATAQQQLSKQVPFLTHLYPPKSTLPPTLASAPSNIHPSILTLTLHTKSQALTGSTARTSALLLVIKRVIQSYVLPPSTALSRHLTAHLSHQINYLTLSRPLSIPQGNAIRWLKKLISGLDPSIEEATAKQYLCTTIDTFIRERITLAQDVIIAAGAERIQDHGEVILTFGKSSLVERTLIHAAREMRKRFKVICVSARPFHEGENLARGLLRAGMHVDGELDWCEVVMCSYAGIGEVLIQQNVTICLLGSAGMLGDGGLYGRCGTAGVVCLLRSMGKHVPVVVLAETLKFTGRTSVDSLCFNELGDVDRLVDIEKSGTIMSTRAEKKDEGAAKKDKKGGGKKAGAAKDKDEDVEDEEQDDMSSALGGWKEQPNLYLLNLMYDITPAEYVDMVVCELGSLPPGAVPVVNGVHGGDE